MKKNEKFFTTKRIVRIALLSSLAAVLMYFEFPLPFLAPDFYKLDFSEVPVLISGFLMGPLTAVVVELMKILIIFSIKGSFTAGVGEVANFLIGCSLVVPATIIYRKKKSLKSMIIGCIVGIIIMTIFGAFLNYYVLIPVYAKAFQLPLEAYVELGRQFNPHVVDLKALIVICVVPFNLVKGTLVSLIASLLYARIGKALSRY